MDLISVSPVDLMNALYTVDFMNLLGTCGPYDLWSQRQLEPTMRSAFIRSTLMWTLWMYLNHVDLVSLDVVDLVLLCPVDLLKVLALVDRTNILHVVDLVICGAYEHLPHGCH